MDRLQHTEGMPDENNNQPRVWGAGHLDPETREANARNAALKRWGSTGRLTGDALKKRNAENNRRWRAQKKLKDSLASGQETKA